VSSGRKAMLAATGLLAVAPSFAGGAEVVRIGVATGKLEVEVSGPDLVAEPLREGATPARVAGGVARLRLSGRELLLGGEPVAGAGVAFSASGPIRHGGSELSGTVEVRRGLDGLAVIDVLPLEDYVGSVTGAEMPPSFPAEALKAQAIAARTFAVGKKVEARQLGLDFDLGASVLDQVYPGAGTSDARARAAASATEGEVLVFEHRPVEAYFHSSCGGATEAGVDALGRDLPYLRSVPCKFCRGAPKYRWELLLSAAELGQLAGLSRAATGARVVRRSAAGRVMKLEVEAGSERVTLDGAELRRRAGYDRMPSLAFLVRSDRRGFAFEGRGSGHGAGLCQWGAAGMARAGADYRRILLHYYPGAELVKMY